MLCPYCGDPVSIDGKCDCNDTRYLPRALKRELELSDEVAARFDKWARSQTTKGNS